MTRDRADDPTTAIGVTRTLSAGIGEPAAPAPARDSGHSTEHRAAKDTVVGLLDNMIAQQETFALVERRLMTATAALLAVRDAETLEAAQDAANGFLRMVTLFGIRGDEIAGVYLDTFNAIASDQGYKA